MLLARSSTVACFGSWIQVSPDELGSEFSAAAATAAAFVSRRVTVSHPLGPLQIEAVADAITFPVGRNYHKKCYQVLYCKAERPYHETGQVG